MKAKPVVHSVVEPVWMAGWEWASGRLLQSPVEIVERASDNRALEVAQAEMAALSAVRGLILLYKRHTWVSSAQV